MGFKFQFDGPYDYIMMPLAAFTVNDATNDQCNLQITWLNNANGNVQS
jgi:hypothetical protein